MSSKKINTSPTDKPTKKNQDILSEYILKGIIGKGTFSVVKLGENKKTKEKVAIKIMQKNKIINKEDLIRIHREIEMLRRLKHPNVIKIHKIQEDTKKFYIIMEYCENGEIFNRIVEKQHLSEDEAAYFYYQIICGLEYIHKNDISHRDLKPENLLLSKDDILKIIDFGLSNYSSFNFLLGTPCGSPCYASPEMVSGKKYNGFLIDIWSTGIILFAMICGYLPFEDNDNEALFCKILKCKIYYPKHIGELPLDLMKKIIVPEPSKRITLNQIKEHPFYLKGKFLFNQRHPEINNDKIKEILIKNITPIIINNPIKNKEIKEITKKKTIDVNNYLINLDNINKANSTYQANVTEIYNYNPTYTEILNINKNVKENMNSKSYEKVESPLSILNPDEIPMDSVPKESNDDKINISDNIIKKPVNNIKKQRNKLLNKDKNNDNKKIIMEFYPNDNSYNTIGHSTTTTSNPDFIYNSENNNFNKITKYSFVTQPVQKMAYIHNKNISIFEDKNKKLINKIKNNYISNSVPKNNEKNIKNNYIEKQKYPHNNYNKLNHKILKKIQNISQINNTPNFSKKVDKNIYINDNNNENNMNLTNMNPSFNNLNTRLNTYIFSINNNNTINAITEKKNNKQKIFDIFSELQLIQKNKKKNIDLYNKPNYNINTNENTFPNILDTHSLSIDKELPSTSIKDENLKQINKDSLALNKYIETINHTIKTKNKINIYSDRDYKTINNKTTKTFKNQNILIKENSPIPTSSEIDTNLTKKYFDSITINNNNSINLHEPKLYIYFENNNSNTINTNINSNGKIVTKLKTNNNEKNKTKTVFKKDKKNYTTKHLNKRNTNINKNTVEQTKKILNKKISAKDDEIINRISLNDKYNFYNSNDKNNKTMGIFNDYNKNLLEIIKKKNNVTTNKKEYNNVIDTNNKVNYLFNSNDKIFDTSKNNNNINYITNRSINLNYYHKSNTNKNFIDKNDYLYYNTNTNNNTNGQNINKTEVNMDIWNYDREKRNDMIVNNLNENYFMNDNSRNIKGKNINIMNNYISSTNNKSSIVPFENMDYKIKLQKMQKKNITSNNINENKNIKIFNDNYKYIVPKTHNISNIEPLVNYRKLNTIVTESIHSPFIQNNLTNHRNYKKFIRIYK